MMEAERVGESNPSVNNTRILSINVIFCFLWNSIVNRMYNNDKF